MTMTPEQLLENFKSQQAQTMDEIRKLDVELSQKKELFVKLQGAIEGLGLLNTDPGASTEITFPEAESEVVTEELE
jgi:hypothetical protein